MTAWTDAPNFGCCMSQLSAMLLHRGRRTTTKIETYDCCREKARMTQQIEALGMRT